MDEKIFRKEAMEKISSPEQMNDYIKVVRPGIWIVLVAIVAFLAGFAVWGVFGTIESTSQAVVVVEDGQAIIYVNEESVDVITTSMVVEIDGSQYSILQDSNDSVNASEVLDANALHVAGMSDGDWACYAEVNASLEDGVYDATLITEKVNPIYFIVN